MRIIAILSFLLLSGCTDPEAVPNGDNGDTGDRLPDGMFRVGGTIENYRGRGLVLSLNFGAETLNVPIGATSFTFRTLVADRAGYNVTVATYPVSPAQECVVTGGQGTVSGASVEDIAVDCDLQAFTVGGLVAGLREGSELVLQNNGGDDLIVDRSGVFTFSERVREGDPYRVTIAQQPVDLVHTCTLDRAEGVVSGGRVTNVSVSCKLHCGPEQACGDTTFCDAPCGAEGLCERRPTSCDPVVSRVCGCDDVIYDNRCEANRAGVSSRSLAACRVRTCNDNSECDEGELCFRERGACEGSGECLTVPGACGDEFEPVCTCEGETFTNECEAYRGRQTVDYDGVCDGS